VAATDNGVFSTIEPEMGMVDASGVPMKVVPRVGRNERCACGSGKKFKRCHGT
jgi:uncharacterized protein YchJ